MAGARPGLRWLRRMGSLALRLRPAQLDPTWERIAARLSPGDLAVQGGPFAGMRYLRFPGGSGLLPKIAGTYELELHAAIEEAVARRPERLLNIGCAEGYYAVGFALRLGALRVHAFDIDAAARLRLRRLAHHNGVAARIRVQGRCSHRLLEALIVPRTLVVCDCEGCEQELLDPARAPALARADILVEVHVERDGRLGARLLRPFEATHAATPLLMEDRAALLNAPHPVLERLAPDDRGMALFERDETTEWLWLRSRAWPGSQS